MSDINKAMDSASPEHSAADKDARMWAMILHLSLLANVVAPIVGIVAPIVIWQIKKDEFAIIDVHGKNAINWLISLAIYVAIGILLILLVVGFFVLVVLGVLAVVFPIIAGIKANEGKVWKYPLSIQFFK